MRGIIEGGVWFPKEYARLKAAEHHVDFLKQAEEQVAAWKKDGMRFAIIYTIFNRLVSGNEAYQRSLT